MFEATLLAKINEVTNTQTKQGTKEGIGNRENGEKAGNYFWGKRVALLNLKQERRNECIPHHHW